jgi:hypothetical protein
MYAALKTELVDWKSLNSEDQQGKGDELIRHVSSLFALTARHCTDEQIYTYDVVLQRLSDIVDVEGRAYASNKLSTAKNAPYSLIRRFAFDVIKVAGPVLRKSPVLNDQDLQDVSDECGAEHMLAISCRKDLSAKVTDLLIHYAHGPVLMQLAANGRAQISQNGMALLTQMAANDAKLAQNLEQRQNQQESMRLVKNPTSPLAQNLELCELVRGLESQIPSEKLDLSHDPYLARYRFEASVKRAKDLEKNGRLNETSLLRYAGHDQFSDVICGIAQISGISYKILARMMSSMHWEQALCLFKALRFSDRLVSELLCCGPWKLRLSRNQCVSILKQYRQMSVEEGHAKVLLWSQNGILLD